MAFSLAKGTLCMTLMLAILLALGSRTTAGTIVQTAAYHFADNDTSFQYYNQFNPSLGKLLDVTIQSQGDVGSGLLTFINSTAVDQTFNGSVSFLLSTDGGSTYVSNAFTLTLAPGESVKEGVSLAYDLSQSYANTSLWVGTGQLGANEFGLSPFLGLSGTSDNPNITISSFVDTGMASMTGVETVTYLYGVPEPPSFTLMVTSCLGLLAVLYSHGTRTTYFCRRRPIARWSSKCNSSRSRQVTLCNSTCLRCCQAASTGFKSGA